MPELNHLMFFPDPVKISHRIETFANLKDIFFFFFFGWEAYSEREGDRGGSFKNKGFGKKKKNDTIYNRNFLNLTESRNVPRLLIQKAHTVGCCVICFFSSSLKMFNLSLTSSRQF